MICHKILIFHFPPSIRCVKINGQLHVLLMSGINIPFLNLSAKLPLHFYKISSDFASCPLYFYFTLLFKFRLLFPLNQLGSNRTYNDNDRPDHLQNSQVLMEHKESNQCPYNNFQCR